MHGLRAHRDSLIVAGVALAARLSIVVWAAGRIPPTADGDFYHIIASRIAQGMGYTWLWPDGTVTYAAHYPVGYPSLLALTYLVIGAAPFSGMLLNALLGAFAAVGAHLLAKYAASPRRALVVGLLVALHVALVPYTAALMTEGVAAAAWIGAVLVAMVARSSSGRRRVAWLAGLGIVLGAATLVRPQTLLLIPFLAWLATPWSWTWRKRLGMAGLVCVLSVATFSPWVVRNHVRMGEAGLSFNGGWNLLIGATPSAQGTFAPLEVPPSCREVFDEAQKDICFGRAASDRIVADPVSWLALVPKKWGATFDYCGAAGWYLHEANPVAFPYRAKVVLGAAETLFVRGLLMAALVSMALAAGPRRRARIVIAVAGCVFLFTPHAWPSMIGLLVVLLLFGRKLDRMPVAVAGTAGAIAVTLFSHAVFFGAGRYAMVLFPLLTVLAGGVGPLRPHRRAPGTEPAR